MDFFPLARPADVSANGKVVHDNDDDKIGGGEKELLKFCVSTIEFRKIFKRCNTRIPPSVVVELVRGHHLLQ